MTQTHTIAAEPRTPGGKGAARSTRRDGRIPAVIYGSGREPEPLMVSSVDFEKLLKTVTGSSTVIELEVGGEKVQTLIREIQRHPTRKRVTHIDFYEIHAGEAITVGVPLHLVGNPEGVRNAGGVLEQFLREVEVEVLPKDIPEVVDVDVTDLSVGGSLHLSDIEIPNARILADPSTTICTVVPPRVEEEPVVAEVEELEEGVEPELIRKPKDEEEAEDTGEE